MTCLVVQNYSDSQVFVESHVAILGLEGGPSGRHRGRATPPHRPQRGTRALGPLSTLRADEEIESLDSERDDGRDQPDL